MSLLESHLRGEEGSLSVHKFSNIYIFEFVTFVQRFPNLMWFHIFREYFHGFTFIVLTIISFYVISNVRSRLFRIIVSCFCKYLLPFIPFLKMIHFFQLSPSEVCALPFMDTINGILTKFTPNSSSTKLDWVSNIFILHSHPLADRNNALVLAF